MLAVSLVCTLFFGKSTLQQQTTEQTAQRTTAGYVLRAHDAPGLPPASRRPRARLPGVAQASGTIATSVVVARRRQQPPHVPGARRRCRPRSPACSTSASTPARWHDLHGDALAVSTQSAQAFGWHLGDRVQLWLGDGTPVDAARRRDLRAPARLRRRRPAARARRAPRHATARRRRLRAGAPGADRRSSSGLRTLARATSDLEVAHPLRSTSDELEPPRDKQSLASTSCSAVIGVFCALALVNAMTMATAERAREFALLRLVGASKRQVRAMVRGETLIMVAFGLAIGSLIAAPGLAVVQPQPHRLLVPAVPLWASARCSTSTRLLGFAATVLPTRLALRMNPVKAMAARE